MNKRHAGLSALMVAALGLAGCSQVNEMMGTQESINYKGAQRADPLSIPPDLTQASADPRYRAPAGTATTFSQYQQQSQAAASAPKSDSVLPTSKGMHIEREGAQRWLVVDSPAEDVFPKVVEFWTESGFTFTTNNPQAGLLQTSWAENRAKIPQDWLHQLLGNVVDTIYDAGTRERFFTRVERGPNNSTEIHINHEQMVETAMGRDNTDFRWVYGKEDPNLNAAMVSRLMVYLGADKDTAARLVKDADFTAPAPDKTSSDADTGKSSIPAPNAVPETASSTLVVGSSDSSTTPSSAKPAATVSVGPLGPQLSLAEPFDRAWREVGVALDSVFRIDDLNRSTGDYYVTDMSGSGTQYRIHVDGDNNQTTVTVRSIQGQRDSSPAAQRILDQIKSKM